MKKLFITVTALLIVPVMLFASWKSAADYKKYIEYKEKGIEADGEGDTTAAVANYRASAALAAKSATVDIQCWRLNDVAYTLILAFKKITNYQEKIDKLSAMEPSREKIAYQKEIAGLLSLHIELLDEAEQVLKEASALNPKAPAEKIRSNSDFIAWVKAFIKDNAEASSAPAAPAAK